MKVVSYTRAISYRAKDENPVNTIGIQNEHIGQYVKAHGWKLSAKYSDRKFSAEEAAAFEQMVEDGINRRYDCVVVDTVFRFGRKSTDAFSVLQSTFYPAGIYFAIVEDDFFSMEKTAKEVEEYFKRKRLIQIRWTEQEAKIEQDKEVLIPKEQVNYGYRLSEDRQSIVIDETAANVVRRIFQSFLSGSNCHKIADDLSRERILPPQVYKQKNYGMEQGLTLGNIWRSETVCGILKNPIYTGKVQRKIMGVDIVIDTTPIVSDEMFYLVQEKLATVPGRIRTWGSGYSNILTQRIYDKETGIPLMCLKSPIDENDRVYALKKRFRYLSREDQKYCISYSVVLAEVRNALEREKALVAQVDGLLQTEEGKRYLEQALEGCRLQAQELLEEMNTAYEQRMKLYKQHEEGKISAEEFATGDDAYWLEMMEIEQAFKQVMEQAEEHRTIYSRINPWLKLYRDIQVPDKLERKHIKQWIDLVAVYQFRTVEVRMKEQEWKAKLPKEWLTLRTEE